MLNVGFEKDVETILNNVPEERQTMLFSATVPKWVKKLVKQFLNDPLDIDLIGEGQSGKMADNIRALAVQASGPPPPAPDTACSATACFALLCRRLPCHRLLCSALPPPALLWPSIWPASGSTPPPPANTRLPAAPAGD